MPRQSEAFAPNPLVNLSNSSMHTAVLCLGRLTGTAPSVLADDGFRRDDILSAEQLVEIALEHGLEAKLIRPGWHELRASLRTVCALLVLRNGNVVLAVENN